MYNSICHKKYREHIIAGTGLSVLVCCHEHIIAGIVFLFSVLVFRLGLSVHVCHAQCQIAVIQIHMKVLRIYVMYIRLENLYDIDFMIEYQMSTKFI